MTKRTITQTKTPDSIREELITTLTVHVDDYIAYLKNNLVDYAGCLEDPQWDWLFDFNEWR